MYRVVLDPVVILRGLINPHSICGKLLSEHAGRYKTVLSEIYRPILTILIFHPVLLSKYGRLRRVGPDQVGRLFARAEKVSIEGAEVANLIVATAIAANADYLICEDKALLSSRDQIEQYVPVLSASQFVMLLASELP